MQVLDGGRRVAAGAVGAGAGAVVAGAVAAGAVVVGAVGAGAGAVAAGAVAAGAVAADGTVLGEAPAGEAPLICRPINVMAGSANSATSRSGSVLRLPTCEWRGDTRGWAGWVGKYRCVWTRGQV